MSSRQLWWPAFLKPCMVWELSVLSIRWTMRKLIEYLFSLFLYTKAAIFGMKYGFWKQADKWKKKTPTKFKWWCYLKINVSVTYKLKLFKHMEMYVKSIYCYVIFCVRISVCLCWQNGMPYLSPSVQSTFSSVLKTFCKSWHKYTTG